MSLINDALKRASQPQPKREEKELPSMQPNYRPVRTGGPGSTILIVCFLVAAAVTLGFWFYFKRGGTLGSLKPAAPPVAASAPAPREKLTTNNNPIARAAQTLNKVDAQNKEGEAVADSIQASKAAPANPLASQPAARIASANPTPKLQAIFFSKNPSALINGKSVRIGDEVDGAKVILITSKTVQIQSGDVTRELSLK